KKSAGATHTAHHFIGDKEDTITVADLPNPTKVSRHRHQASGRRTTDCFGDESSYSISPFTKDYLFQFVCYAGSILLIRLTIAAAAIGVTGRYEFDLIRQIRTVAGTPGIVTADG